MSTQGDDAVGEPDRRALLQRLRIDHEEDREDDRGQGLIAVLAFGCTLFATGAAFVFWPAGTSAEPQMQVRASDAAAEATAPPVAGTGDVLTASGYVTARRRATVSAELTGRVAEVLIEEGMSVAAGQLLARLDPTLAKIDLAVAEGHLKAARGALALAAAERAEAHNALARIRGLKARQFASTAEGTRAQAVSDSAEARLVQAQGQLAALEQAANRARAVLDKHDIRAPFAGVVTTKDAQPGEIVSPAAAGGGFTRSGIGTIVDMGSLEIEVEVNEAFISRVTPGQKASATLDAYPERQLRASVSAIVPTANRDKATVKVRVAIETPDPRTLPEMAAKVSFHESNRTPLGVADASQGRSHARDVD